MLNTEIQGIGPSSPVLSSLTAEDLQVLAEGSPQHCLIESGILMCTKQVYNISEQCQIFIILLLFYNACNPKQCIYFEIYHLVFISVS